MGDYIDPRLANTRYAILQPPDLAVEARLYAALEREFDPLHPAYPHIGSIHGLPFFTAIPAAGFSERYKEFPTFETEHTAFFGNAGNFLSSGEGLDLAGLEGAGSLEIQAATLPRPDEEVAKINSATLDQSASDVLGEVESAALVHAVSENFIRDTTGDTHDVEPVIALEKTEKRRCKSDGSNRVVKNYMRSPISKVAGDNRRPLYPSDRDDKTYTVYQREIFRLVSMVPFGRVTTGRELAKHLNSSGNSVSYAIKKLPHDRFPAHRVVGMTYVSGKMRLATGKDFDRYREKLKQEGVQVDDRGFITDESVFWNGFKEPQVAVKRVAGTSNEGNLAEAASRQDTDLVSNNLGLFGAAFVPHAPIDLETSDGDMTAANAGIRRHTGTKFGNGTAAMTNRLMGVWMVRG